MTAAPVLSFDLGGTRMRAALVAGDGSVLAMAEGFSVSPKTGEAMLLARFA